METENLYVSALVAKYDAEIKECLAMLNTYFNKGVAIGEHPDLQEEMDKYIEKLANATDKKETVQKYFTSGGSIMAQS